MNSIRQMMTGKDNITVDFLRVMAVLAIVLFFGLTIASFILQRAWDAQAYAVAYGMISLAAAGSLKLKETLEPDAPDAPDISDPKLVPPQTPLGK